MYFASRLFRIVFNFQYITIINGFVSEKRRLYHSLIDFPGQFIYSNDHEDTAYNRICSKEMDSSAAKFVIKYILIATGGYSCVFTACYASFWMNNKTTTTSLKVPFVDENTDEEYYYNSALQWLLLFHSTFLAVGFEIAMTLFENFARLAPKLIHLEFTESIDKYKCEELSELQIRVALKNALVQCLDFDKYEFTPPWV